MRYIGIDYGSKRIGIAVSDEDGWIAFPREVIEGGDDERVFRRIGDIVKQENVGCVVVGLPIPFGGGSSKQTEDIRMFAEHLSELVQLPVELENEVLTSRMGEKEGVRKEDLDKASAALILQSYLDKKNQES
ncbi:MAG: Holliday junction resolvase RuvX [Patescibacteria group bacterium]